jgi:hypothetical protein
MKNLKEIALLHEVIEFLKESKRSHYICDEDCWYSCPKSGKNCDESMPDECHCNADKDNNKIDEMIIKIEKFLQ